MRTSKNDPIRVDFINGRHLGDRTSGRLGLTIAPGKKDPVRHWDRDLDADLEHLRSNHAADLLVSLMEDHEHDYLKIPSLATSAAAAGLEVRRFPIRDVDVPKSSAMPAFSELVDGIADALAAGRAVIVHCRGGLGRSGLVAASVLVRLGLNAEAAIRATREARPGAIETGAQQAWVARYAEHRAARTTPDVVDGGNLDAPAPHCGAPRLSAFRGCLLGGALGDALGYPIEFDKSPAIFRAHGAEPPTKLNFAGGEQGRISDDTQMTLFTAEGLIRARLRIGRKGICHPPTVVAFALLRWYETQGGRRASGNESHRGWLVEDRRLHSQRAPGNTCMSALARLVDQTGMLTLPTVATPPNDSKGCGAVMRAAPCGLVAPTRAAAFELARDTGVITHGHPSGYLSGAYFAALIWDLVRGTSLEGAMLAADTLLAAERGATEMQHVLARTRTLAQAGAPGVAAIESLGGGWTGEEALAIALLCALTIGEHEPIEAALWRAAAHSGDSDSTAAITGNLLGTMRGVGALPPSWLAVLELRDVTDRLASDLFSAWIEGEDLLEYPGH